MSDSLAAEPELLRDTPSSPPELDGSSGQADSTIAPIDADAAYDGEPLVIEPKSGWVPVDFRELIRYRELLFFLVWRDVKVRYKQTVLGVAWAILVPIFSVTVFTIIFGNFAGLKNTLPESLIAAYPVYVYAGMMPWLFFSTGISQGGMSLVSQQQLLTKIYFPRLFVPTATVSGSLVDMGLSFCVFLTLMAIYGVAISPTIVLLPFLVLMVWCASLGIAYTLSALTVTYRDFRFVVPFMVQAWQFLSPVVYPTTIVPEKYRLLYALNPMAGIIEGFRSAIFGTEVPWGMLGMSLLTTVTLLVFGMLYFRKTERRFADIA
ncbi:ABC transporter permease [Aeoliella mucimassa]|uniref:Transport permease protein n=1 Tax=Aeoliella mucimassa TaxID=2527972 RepID=A0A518AQA8_9BACT|nr:ABC transporter permease [Aeoliella mucimassa]QDU56906.1 Teichoic acid translocation permease protein TagG [Aeoliella mucimassa]